MPTRRPVLVRPITTTGTVTTAPRPGARHLVRRRLSLAAAAVVAVVALTMLGTGVASAHVTVNPGEAAAGSYAKLTFRVPTESDTASTVGLTVTLPTDHPLPSVSLMPVPGWTATTTTATFDPPVTEGRFTLTEATASVTWTATGDGAIKPGEFQEFSLSVGPIPDVSSLVFPAKQTYSDGSVVEWKDVAAAGIDPHSLDHPAPLLTVTPAAAEGTAVAGDEDATAGAGAAPAGAGVAPAGAAPAGSAAEAPPATASTSDTTAQILGAAALIVAAAALLVAVAGWRRSRGAPRTTDEADRERV